MSAARAIPEKHGGELADHASVRLWLRLLSCSVTIEKALRRRLEAKGTTLPRFDVLAALDRSRDGMAMSALSRALLVSNANVTGIVRKLGDEGLVAVGTAPGDRRVSIVRLTPAGIRHFAGLATAHHGWVEELLAPLSPGTRDALHADLGRLKLALAAADRTEVR